MLVIKMNGTLHRFFKISSSSASSESSPIQEVKKISDVSSKTGSNYEILDCLSYQETTSSNCKRKKKTLNSNNKKVRVCDDDSQLPEDTKETPTADGDKDLIMIIPGEEKKISNEQRLVRSHVLTSDDWSNLKSNRNPLTQAEFFPNIPHITQSDGSEVKGYSEYVCSLQFLPSNDTSFRIQANNRSIGLSTDRKSKSGSTRRKPKQMNAKQIQKTLKALQEFVEDFPVQSFYQKLVGDRIMAKANRIDDEILWTDKYRPTNSSHLLIDEGYKHIMKEWFLSWKSEIENPSENQQFARKHARNSKKNDDSDSESETNKALLPVMLITGPSGVGKTTSVYTLANELGYKVFEVNPSMLRTSKSILDSLKESTSSHQVTAGKGDATSSVNSFFTKIKEKSSSKKSEKRVGQKKAAVVSESKSSNDALKLSKLSLILFDEADIVFEDDKCFYETIKSLAQEAKKPIILTSKDEKFMNQITEDYIHVQLPQHGHSELAVYLMLVCLIENHVAEYEPMLKLVDHSHGDLRHCLLQLMFFIQGEGLPTSKVESVATNRHVQEKNSSSSDQLKSLSNIYKYKTHVDMIHSKYRRTSKLISDKRVISPSVPTSDEMATLIPLRSYYREMVCRTFGSPLLELVIKDKNAAHNSSTVMQSLRDSLPEALSSISDSALSVDLFPFIQNVCQAENFRKESKASRRFLHRLDKAGVFVPELVKEKSCSIFSMDNVFPQNDISPQY